MFGRLLAPEPHFLVELRFPRKPVDCRIKLSIC